MPSRAVFVTAIVVIVSGCGADESAPPPPAPIVINTAIAAPAPPADNPQPSADDQPRPDPERRKYNRAHYTKYEYRIPMRDGVRLFTAVYVPIDAGPQKKYPFLIDRTPYSIAPYGANRYDGRLGPNIQFDKAGYIFVNQDVRGRFMSEGTFVHMRPQLAGGSASDDVTDTYDTIDWLLKHVEYNNGKAGQWGNSYDGYYTTVGALSRHPALVAVSPQAPVADWWQGDDMHRNGAFNLQEAFTFFRALGPEHTTRRTPPRDNWWRPLPAGTPDQYRYFLELGPLANVDAKLLDGDIPFWRDLVAHPDYDEFWQARNLRPRIKDVTAAALVVGSWYDTENLFGALETYQALAKQSPRSKPTLIMGPWRHGFWNVAPGEKLGDARFGFASSAVYQDLVFAFFEHHLRGKPAPDLPAALVFEGGANRWRRFDRWPPRATREQTLYLHGGRRLGFEPPAAGGPAFDEYVSDPARPVPHTLDNGVAIWSANYMAEDQRPFSRRPDVLVYETPPLEQDVTLAGPLEVALFVSTTGTDADWVVKLVDVEAGTLGGLDAEKAGESHLESGEPNRGHQETLVRGEPFRGRYREGGERSVPFKPGEVAQVKFTVDDVFHTFKRGNRIQIQIQSSWFPFIDRNPQTFVPNIFAAKPADFIKATHRVYRAGAQASSIRVRVLPLPDEAAAKP